MLAHPILINRPIVVTPWGVKLCRPSEAVLDYLATPQKGPFAKEDRELLTDKLIKYVLSHEGQEAVVQARLFHFQP